MICKMTVVYRFYSFHQELEHVFLFLLCPWTRTTVGLPQKWSSSSAQKNHCFWKTQKFSLSFAELVVISLYFCCSLKQSGDGGGWIPSLRVATMLCLSCLTKQPLFHWPLLCTNLLDFGLRFNFVTEPEIKVEVTCEWM